MTVAKFTQTNYTTQDSSTYKAAIDADIQVMAGIAGAFAPHQSATPNMTVTIDPGRIFINTTTLVNQSSSQVSGTITPPASPYSRIDRIVIDAITAVVSIIPGTDTYLPSAPAIPSGKLPIAQVYLQTGISVILNSNITDERVLGGSNAPADGTITETKMAASAISQSKLKTSSGSVSLTASGSPPLTSLLTLPGGTYGFYPTTSLSDSLTRVTDSYARIFETFTSGSVTAGNYISLHVNFGTSGTSVLTATQRYISASGSDHWIFLLKDKSDGHIISVYEAPDHPSANTQLTDIEIPHPFGSYDPAKHEIVLADNSILETIRPYVGRQKKIIDVINQACVIDDAKSTDYQAREIHKINEYPEDPIGGEVIAEMKTPKGIASTMISAEVITLENFVVDKLPAEINYRALAFDESKLT